MSSSSFAPDFSFPGGPNGNIIGGNNSNDPPEGPQEIFRYNPFNHTGVPTWFNWLGVNDVGTDAIKNTSAPGKIYPIFRKIPDELLKTDRPYYSIGNNETEYGVEANPNNSASTERDRGKGSISYAGSRYIKSLFDNTQSEDDGIPKNWGFAWNDYYSSPNKWWQFYSAYFVNYSDKLYPFPVKGISCRIKTPGNKTTGYVTNVGPFNKTDPQNWGDHTIINKVHGLWRDIEGFYYIFEMLPYGDNSLRMWSGKGTAGRNMRNVWTHGGAPAAEMYGPDSFYIFPRRNNQIKKTDKWLSEVRPFVKPGAQKALAMWTMEPAVENLFFCGVNIEMHHDRKAGKWRPHTTLISRVTPIPFHMPRHDKRTTVVLGEPTSLEDLRKGLRKIHFWNPPEGSTDSLDDYIEPPYEPKGEDTVGPEDTIAGDVFAVYVPTGPYFPDTIDTTNGEDYIENSGEPSVFELPDEIETVEGQGTDYIPGQPDPPMDTSGGL